MSNGGWRFEEQEQEVWNENRKGSDSDADRELRSEELITNTDRGQRRDGLLLLHLATCNTRSDLIFET